MNPFQGLINAISGAFSTLIRWLGSALGQFFGGLIEALQFISAWLLSFFTNAIGYIVETGLAALLVIVGWFPDLPAAPSWEFPGWLVDANRYVPLSEAVGLGATWAVIFGAVFLYKLAKFVRGGG